MNKRFLSLVLSIVLVASLFTGFVSTANADDVNNYVVHDGDYLFKICKAQGLDYYQCKNAIMVLNGFSSDVQLNRLTIGQTVKLPASNAVAATVKATSATTTTVTTSTTVNGKTTTTTSTSTVSGNLSNYNVAFYLIPHVMQYGDTLASVCNTYGTSYGQYSSMLLGANNISNANNIWAGKTVYVPSTKAPAAGGFYAVVNHVVSSGETMTSICNNYGTNYAANAALINGLNSKKNLNTIYAGQSLYIPVVSSVVNNPTTSGTTAGGSSSGSAVVENGNDIIFEGTDKGSAFAVVDGAKVSKAEMGKTVTIIPNAKVGYAQSEIAVTRADSLTDVKVTNNTFVMPPCGVTVSVVYRDAFALTKIPQQHGTYKTLVNGVEADFAIENDVVVLAFSPDAGYSCAKAQYTIGNGTPVAIKQGSDGTWSFVMPKVPESYKGVTIDVTFERQGGLYNLKSSVVDTSGNVSKNASVSFSVNDVACTKASKGVQVVANITAKESYGIKSVEISYGGGVPISYTKQDASNYLFKMQDGEVTVTVTVEYSKRWALKDISNENGTITFMDKDYGNISSAKAGDTVRVYVKPKSWFDYKVGSLRVTYADTKAQVPDLAKVSGTDFEFTFTMVAADVSATAIWAESATRADGQIKAVSCENGYWDVRVNRGGSWIESKEPAMGDLVRIYVRGVEGYVCTEVKIYHEDSRSSWGTYVITPTEDPPTGFTRKKFSDNDIESVIFEMPGPVFPVTNGNVCFEAKFERTDNYVKIENYENKTEGSIYAFFGGAGVWEAKTGSTIEIVYTPNEGYSLASLKLERVNVGETIDLPINNNKSSYTVVRDDYSSVSTKNILRIIPTFAGVQKSFSVTSFGENYTVNEQRAGTQLSLAANELVTIKPTGSNKFDLEKTVLYYLSSSDGSRINITDFDTYTQEKIEFKVPTGNVFVEASIFAPPLTISVGSESGCTVKITSSNVVSAGETVYFNVELSDPNYVISTVSTSTSKGTITELNHANGVYYYQLDTTGMTASASISATAVAP